MDWNNYDPVEHAKMLIRREGSCNAPYGHSCDGCFVATKLRKVTAWCTPDTAYENAKIFLDDTPKIRSIWQEE